VAEVIEKGVSSEQNLFFTQVNVPTRAFSLGFPTEAGATVKTDEGENLFEYFALRFDGGLSLAGDEEEGEYELALLSDDGATWSIRPTDTLVGQFKPGEDPFSMVVNNDGNHPTRLGCGETILMKRNMPLDVRFDYTQGPRYHISMIPMWRKVTATTQSETRCRVQAGSAGVA
jgi:hypothetical protein